LDSRRRAAFPRRCAGGPHDRLRRRRRRLRSPRPRRRLADRRRPRPHGRRSGRSARPPPMTDPLIRNAEVGGRAGLDVRLAGGRIAEIGERLSGGDAIDGRGGALVPGLADHHIHLLATAARRQSLVLDDVAGPAELRRRFRQALAACAPGAWLRATGYHEHRAGPLTRADLDALAPTHPVRVQHQTGALWILNTAALARLGPDLPEGAE